MNRKEFTATLFSHLMMMWVTLALVIVVWVAFQIQSFDEIFYFVFPFGIAYTFAYLEFYFIFKNNFLEESEEFK